MNSGLRYPESFDTAVLKQVGQPPRHPSLLQQAGERDQIASGELGVGAFVVIECREELIEQVPTPSHRGLGVQLLGEGGVCRRVHPDLLDLGLGVHRPVGRLAFVAGSEPALGKGPLAGQNLVHASMVVGNVIAGDKVSHHVR